MRLLPSAGRLLPRIGAPQFPNEPDSCENHRGEKIGGRPGGASAQRVPDAVALPGQPAFAAGGAAAHGPAELETCRGGRAAEARDRPWRSRRRERGGAKHNQPRRCSCRLR
ncbi:unnamed protein product [Amoebophrya sp. A120]|nr:unnamed protein product [Amoebophrya sp. A120]|eukprot:GSA120T00011433001.1